MSIKRLRVKHGFTQQGLSDYTGIPKRTIENWEGGQRSCPLYLEKLLQFFLENSAKPLDKSLNGWYNYNCQGGESSPPERRKGKKVMKYEVRYECGEARMNPGQAVDYMLAMVPVEDGEVELYAEAEPVEDDECGTYDDLKAEILRQAEKAGINVETLKFHFDD